MAEVDRLSCIAMDVYRGNRGSFLKAIADAWCKADPNNKRILRPAWTRIVEKYGLDKNGTGGTNP